MDKDTKDRLDALARVADWVKLHSTSSSETALANGTLALIKDYTKLLEKS